MNKKRILVIIVIIGVVLTSFFAQISFSFENNEIIATISNFKIYISGKEQYFQNDTVVIDNKVYVPLREFSEKLGKEVDFDEKLGEVYLSGTVFDNANVGVETDAVASYVGDDWIVFEDENGKFGYKDAEGNIVIESQFYGACEFHEGRALVYRPLLTGEHGMANYIFGYIDTKGTIVIPYQYFCSSYFDFWNFVDGFACIPIENNSTRTIFINRNGDNEFGKIFLSAYPFSEGYAMVQISGACFPMPDAPPQKYSYIDKTGELATDKEWDSASSFKNGTAIVELDGVRMRIDKNFGVVEYID